MNHYKVIISLALVVLMGVSSLTACSLPDSINTQRPDQLSGAVTQQPAETTREITADPVPMARAPVIPDLLMPVASGNRVERNAKAMIDYSNTADGYVMVKWLAQTSRQLRVQVTGPDDSKYTYTIFPDDTFEVFPLSGGNGSYLVRVLEQSEGDRYAVATTLEVKVTLQDEFAPFLRPNQFVNFDESSNVVRKAAELVAGKDNMPEMVAAVYDFITKNITYDRNFAQQVIDGSHRGYVPDLDKVLSSGKGICFDYAAVMTAMLRSQGIPTRLVFGHVDEVYHAWIDVYSEETGWVNSAIFFDGENWLMMDPTFAAAASSAAALAAFIGDGGNYSVKHLF